MKSLRAFSPRYLSSSSSSSLSSSSLSASSMSSNSPPSPSPQRKTKRGKGRGGKIPANRTKSTKKRIEKMSCVVPPPETRKTESKSKPCAPCKDDGNKRVTVGSFSCHPRSVPLVSCALNDFASMQFMATGPECVKAPSICHEIHHHHAELGFARQNPPFILDISCQNNTCCPIPVCNGVDRNVNLGFPYDVVPQPLHCSIGTSK